jgi:hypothetical protein
LHEWGLDAYFLLHIGFAPMGTKPIKEINPN